MTKNYTYGCKPPHVNLDRVNDQIFKAHRYRNALVELERSKRTEIAEFQSKLIPGLAEAQKGIESAKLGLTRHYDLISKRNADARSRVATSEDRSRTKELKERMSAAIAAAKACKAVEKSPEYTAGITGIQAKAVAASKVLRANCGVYWGTYLTIEDAANDSFKESRFPPKFMKWEGHGCVAVQLQGGLPVEDAMGCTDTRLKIESTEHPKYFVVYLRIGSEEDKRSPVWTVARVKFHRPIPPGSIIKWAYLDRERVGLTYHWQFRLTIEIPADAIPPKPKGSSGTVGVNLGWRKVPTGLRVAYWVGSDGEQGELIIPRSQVEHCRRPDAMRSRRDVSFNENREALKTWMTEKELPDWLNESAKFIGQWKSPGKLAWLILQWRDKRFPGDEAIYELLESWRKQDKHLCNWEGHERSTNWRKEMYHQFAVMLSQRYAKIITEDSNWAKMLKKPMPDEAEKLYTRYASRIASVGQLRQILVEYGAVKSPAKDNTRKCHACGSVNDFDAAARIVHQCSGCGVSWDQDYNASKNSIASGDVVPGEQGPSEGVTAKRVKRGISAAEYRRRVAENRASRKSDGKSSG